MNNLIKISTGDNGGDVQTVNARELHAFLESRQQFADWIKGRVEQYGFVEGQDFTVHSFMNGRAKQVDYHLTLDMGKELAMVERTDKGKLARQYFIACEKQLHEGKQDWKRMRHAAAARNLGEIDRVFGESMVAGIAGNAVKF